MTSTCHPLLVSHSSNNLLLNYLIAESSRHWSIQGFRYPGVGSFSFWIIHFLNYRVIVVVSRSSVCLLEEILQLSASEWLGLHSCSRVKGRLLLKASLLNFADLISALFLDINHKSTKRTIIANIALEAIFQWVSSDSITTIWHFVRDLPSVSKKR